MRLFPVLSKRIPIRELQVGDAVDLYRDPVADPYHNPSYAMEQTVQHITYQVGGIFIDFSGNATILFPYNAIVKRHRKALTR